MAALRAVKQGTLITPQKSSRARPPAALCVLKLVVRAQELTSKQLCSAHIHEGVEGAILCAREGVSDQQAHTVEVKVRCSSWAAGGVLWLGAHRPKRFK